MNWYSYNHSNNYGVNRNDIQVNNNINNDYTKYNNNDNNNNKKKK